VFGLFRQYYLDQLPFHDPELHVNLQEPDLSDAPVAAGIIPVQSNDVPSIDPVVIINDAIGIAMRAYSTIHCNCNGNN
jgi:hypothetical protein